MPNYDESKLWNYIKLWFAFSSFDLVNVKIYDEQDQIFD